MRSPTQTSALDKRRQKSYTSVQDSNHVFTLDLQFQCTAERSRSRAAACAEGKEAKEEGKSYTAVDGSKSTSREKSYTTVLGEEKRKSREVLHNSLCSAFGLAKRFSCSC